MIDIVGRSSDLEIRGGTPTVAPTPHYGVKIIDIRLAIAKDWPAIIALAKLLPSTLPDSAAIFVAIRDDQVVGMIACHQSSDGQMPISHLYVTETHRDAGIGTALMQAAIAFAGDTTEMHLVMDRADRRLRRFYRRFGFKPAPLITLRRPAA
jgi:GNAT superfamily N-acetyltransferase